ncbi:Dynein light chain 2, cytoplasmic [Glycine soja]|nr:Dynein light chain 2, cytoplasmic [Glycine soja]
MLLRRRRFDKTTPLATALPQKLTHHQSSFRETERKMSEDAKKNIMIPDMQKEAVDIAVAAFEKYNVEKDVAEQIKKEFDKRHGPTWHCIVGRNFGSYVTHETNHFVYFYLDQKAVLLFKSG